MFRNQYDNDVTVWSPQGRLHQVEYAMEAVKQGSATVGIKNSTHAVLVALKRASSELSAHQKKIFSIDNHVGMSIAGLTADARLLSKYLRTECLNHRYSYDSALPVNRLVSALGNKMQVCTQRYDRRPYGVGLLVAGYDVKRYFSTLPTLEGTKTVNPTPRILVPSKDQGPHIYQTCPSANYFDCKAMAIGARSQSARTYLEKHLDTFKSTNLEELVKHALRALRECLPNEVELSTKNVSIAIVGKGHDFKVFDDEGVAQYLAGIEGEERSRHHPPATSTDASMDEDKNQPEGGMAGPEVATATEEHMSID